MPKVINPTTWHAEQRWIDLEDAAAKRKNLARSGTVDVEEMQLRKRPPTPPRKKQAPRK